jgi:hypothetical protein
LCGTYIAQQDVEALVGKPRKIVDVLLLVADRFPFRRRSRERCRAGSSSFGFRRIGSQPCFRRCGQLIQERDLRFRLQIACGTHHIVLRQRDRHVERAVFGIKFSLVQIRDLVPAVLVEHGRFRVPLRDLVRLPDVAEAGDLPGRDLHLERRGNRNASTASERRRQCQLGDIGIFRVVFEGRSNAIHRKTQGIDRPFDGIVAVCQLLIALVVLLLSKRSVPVSVRVRPQVNVQNIERLRRIVDVFEGFLSAEDVVLVVELNGDRVVDFLLPV